MQQFSSLLSWRLFTAQHVSGVFPPIIRNSMTAVAASGFTFVSWWQFLSWSLGRKSSVVASKGRAPNKHFNLLKPTGRVMHHQQLNIQQLYALPTLYLCVLYLSEKKTATCATYSINWLVFITEMKSVYSAVRTGSLNKAACASSVKG